jgi:competence protein ComEC
MREKLFFFCALFGLVGTVVGLKGNFYLVGIMFMVTGLLKKRFTLKQLSLTLLVFIIFFLNGLITKHFNQTSMMGNESVKEIVFRKSPKVEGDALSGFARDLISGERIWFSYKIKTETEKKLLSESCIVGEVFKIKGNLKPPKHNTVENGFDFFDFLNQNQTHWVCKATQFNHVRKESGFYPNMVQIREKAILRIKKTFPSPLQSYVLALIFGDQNSIDEDSYRAYQKLGVVHLFSISGAQVGILVWFLYAGLIRIGNSQRWSMITVIAIIPFYAGITGFSPSVNRACGMVIILFIGRLFKKRITPLIGLCSCLMMYLFIQPYQIYSIGFQLSFSICCGLILSKNILEQKQMNKISLIFLGTFICQLSSLPIVLYHFYEVSFMGFLSNLVYIPVFSFIYFPLTIIVYFLQLLLETKISPLLSFANLLFHWLSLISDFLAQIPFSIVCFGKPNILVMLSLFVVIFFILVSFEMYKKKLIILSISMLMIILIFQYNINRLSSDGGITYVDVGQGDSIFIQLPNNGGNYLIDTGGILSFQKEKWQMKESEFDTGKDVLLPFLKSKGIRKLDKLILTHADYDHIGGSKAILATLPVESLIMPLGQNADFGKFSWLNLKEVDAIKLIVQEGDSWEVGENFFQVLHPKVSNGDKNSSCIVLYAQINGIKFLFTGDADIAAEDEMLSKYTLNVDVLKTGHHGSKTSTGKSFLKSLNPKVSIISVGENNRYGHPSPELMKELQENQIQIFRTDIDGSINFDFEKGTFTTFPPYHTGQ